MFRATISLTLGALIATAPAMALESFDADPAWDSVNNRPAPGSGIAREQAFGYSATAHAGGEPGEMGGTITRSFTPARYAMAIPEKTLENRLEASGKFAVTASDGGGVLIGWFNENSRGWRTPNSLAIRINGESGAYRVFYEYGTSHWRTGGGQTFEGRYQDNPASLHRADSSVHAWKLVYDPGGAGGDGLLELTLDGTLYSAPMDPGHKADGAVFNRFGLLNQQVAGGTVGVYVDDVVVDGVEEHFGNDPGWEGLGNQAKFVETLIRPHHDFGYSATSHAGGKAGEIGGAFWRVESTEPETSGYYAAPVKSLTLDSPLHASGKVAMPAAAADSGVLIGWFNDATFRGAPPMNFLGVFVEGPSRIGHYFRPVFGTSEDIHGKVDSGPIIHADGKSHIWTLDYQPESGRIAVTLDGEAITLDIPPEARKGKAAFNRFGMLTWLRGGLFVELYLDDLEYTRE